MTDHKIVGLRHFRGAVSLVSQSHGQIDESRTRAAALLGIVHRDERNLLPMFTLGLRGINRRLYDAGLQYANAQDTLPVQGHMTWAAVALGRPPSRGNFGTMRQVHRGPYDYLAGDDIVHLSSRDVVHSFTLNEMRVKQDATPGLVVPSSAVCDIIGCAEST